VLCINYISTVVLVILQPPIGQERVKELGKWVRKQFKVSGNSWDTNSKDIAIAGLGWFGIGLKGEAVLGLWTYDGVDVIFRSSLVHWLQFLRKLVSQFHRLFLRQIA